MNQQHTASVFEILEREQVRFVNLQFVDVLGVVKSVTIPAHRFRHCVEQGEWFDGSSLEGFARVLESDRYLQPDLDHIRDSAVGAGRNHHGARHLRRIHDRR